MDIPLSYWKPLSWSITRQNRLWIVVLFFTVHNAEEALYMKSYPALKLPVASYHHFLFVLAIVTLVPWLVALAKDSPARTAALVTLQIVVAINAFVHLGAVIATRNYAPGIATALAINLPFSFQLLRRARRERWVSSWPLLILAAIVLHGPVLIGLFLVTRPLFR